MYPEVEQYLAAVEAADMAYETARAGTPRHIVSATEEDCPACRVIEPAREARQASTEAAWQALRGSSDPLVRWIADNCGDYRYAAATILRALPAPMADLDAIAAVEGWCGQWDLFRAVAKKAGVLPAETSAAEEVSA